MDRKDWWNRRTLGWAAAVLAVGGALAWAFAPRPVAVEVAGVERGHFEAAIEEDGRTRLKDRYTISTPVTAQVARITLREGDPVRAGDVVAVLTPVVPGLVDERAGREARARLAAAGAGVAVATARIERARVTREDARLDLERTQRLARDGYLAPARLDSARLALDAAVREHEAAQAQRDVAVHERDQAAAALRPLDPDARGLPMQIRSPVGGKVLKVAQPREGTLAAGTALLEVGDPARMEVVAQLLTEDAVRAAPGTPAVVERWGGPPVAARVARVEPAAFTKVSALGIEEQRVNVLLNLEQVAPAWHAMGDGFRVTARIITATSEGVVLVPVGALFPLADGGMGVFRIEGGRARLRPVDLQGRNRDVGWVRAGLEPGERVVVYPPPALVDGKPVQVRRP